jgi:hypothetical protein
MQPPAGHRRTAQQPLHMLRVLYSLHRLCHRYHQVDQLSTLRALAASGVSSNKQIAHNQPWLPGVGAPEG